MFTVVAIAIKKFHQGRQKKCPEVKVPKLMHLDNKKNDKKIKAFRSLNF
jgi:hypothetical protein